MNVESAAINILKRGVELDTKKRYTEALVCYQEGLQILVDKMKDELDDNTKKYLRKKVEEYMNRAEVIKKLVLKQKEEGKFHEQINIENNSTGHSYKTLFGRFLDEDVRYVIVEDPYIRSFHQLDTKKYCTCTAVQEVVLIGLDKFLASAQLLAWNSEGQKSICQNFLRLCELLVKSCSNLSLIELVTSRDSKSEKDQNEWFSNLKNNLMNYRVQLIVRYSETLHDRQIIVSTGWVIKIGRGLDFYKAPENKFSLGVYDLDLRPCHETTVDIVHSKNVKQSYG